MGFFKDLHTGDEDLARFQSDQFDDFLESFLSRLENIPRGDIRARQISIVAKSPDSAAAKTLLRYADAIHAANINIRAVFARLSPTDMISHWVNPQANFRFMLPDQHLRWVKNDCLLDAHEQMILGTSMCWSGDSMRRQASLRDSFELFEENCPATARLGRLAFEALWMASVTIPEARMRNFARAIPVEAVAEFPAKPAVDVTMQPQRLVFATRH